MQRAELGHYVSAVIARATKDGESTICCGAVALCIFKLFEV